MPYCSSIRIKHGTTTILDYGEKLEAYPVINGQKLVQVAAIARASKVKIFERGNESNTISFVKHNHVENAWDSLRNSFRHGNTLPKTKNTLYIYFSDSEATHFRLHDAVIDSWSGTMSDLRESLSANIVGADIEEITQGFTVDSSLITVDSSLITVDKA